MSMRVQQRVPDGVRASCWSRRLIGGSRRPLHVRPLLRRGARRRRKLPDIPHAARLRAGHALM